MTAPNGRNAEINDTGMHFIDVGRTDRGRNRPGGATARLARQLSLSPCDLEAGMMNGWALFVKDQSSVNHLKALCPLYTFTDQTSGTYQMLH
jgi:hypothetical protein